MLRIWKKFPSLKAYPKTWNTNKSRYPISLKREEVISIARDLKIISRVTKKIINDKGKYTLEEKIIFRK